MEKFLTGWHSNMCQLISPVFIGCSINAYEDANFTLSIFFFVIGLVGTLVQIVLIPLSRYFIYKGEMQSFFVLFPGRNAKLKLFIYLSFFTSFSILLAYLTLKENLSITYVSLAFFCVLYFGAFLSILISAIFSKNFDRILTKSYVW